jgi:hypothetical protein
LKIVFIPATKANITRATLSQSTYARRLKHISANDQKHDNFVEMAFISVTGNILLSYSAGPVVAGAFIMVKRTSGFCCIYVFRGGKESKLHTASHPVESSNHFVDAIYRFTAERAGQDSVKLVY